MNRAERFPNHQHKYGDNRNWSDQFIPSICDIVGPRLLIPAPFEIDTQQATDLIVLRVRDLSIAARVRDAAGGYYKRYPKQFTIRSQVHSGVPTELTKIINGWAGWMFYGFGRVSPVRFVAWRIIDLNVFRATLIRDASTCKHPDVSLADRSHQVSNGDGTHFMPFDISDFPAELLIDSYDPAATMELFQ